MRERRTFSELEQSEKVFLVALVIWVLLQMSRAIALTLIGEINTGGESKAWLYPAYLDLFAVVFAPPIVWGLVAKRGLFTWTCTMIYWAISIVDHTGNFVTTAAVGPPSIAEGMNPVLVPAIQTALDILFMVLLWTKKFRQLFFTVEPELLNVS